jgi:hypothetical protein
MLNQQPTSVLAFHSCSLEVGIKVLIGLEELKPSNNKWDWLGDGIYFWEQNPQRALDYAVESAQRKQFNKIPINTPFVLGAIIDLGYCLNLTESGSISILKSAYASLKHITEKAQQQLPVNKSSIRLLDCAVISHLHRLNIENALPAFDTVRGAFPEGDDVYPSSAIKDRTHIQIAVRNPACIKGYFLPRPYEKFNPVINRIGDFINVTGSS